MAAKAVSSAHLPRDWAQRLKPGCVGCKPFQCVDTSTGPALSGCPVYGAAQGGTASGRKPASRSPCPRQRRSARPAGVAMLSLLAAQPIAPMATGATHTAGAICVGCYGAESRSFWPAESLWARRVAAAATESPCRAAYRWRVGCKHLAQCLVVEQVAPACALLTACWG
jgi:hypothetical protein